jgi:ribosome-associated protein
MRLAAAILAQVCGRAARWIPNAWRGRKVPERRITPDRLSISPLRPWIEVRFTRSSGPGGQNVNRVSTRVTLLFDFETCAHLSDSQKARIRRRLKTRLSRDGRLRVVSQVARTQASNRAVAECRLLELLGEALKTRKPRVPTRPTPASRERRLQAKRHRGELKRGRRARPPPDE